MSPSRLTADGRGTTRASADEHVPADGQESVPVGQDMVSGGAARKRDGQSVAAAHDLLRTAILYGELEAGLSLSQAALGDRFGVGRTPLREALRLLQREGLVVAEPNRRVSVAELSAEDFEQLYIMRVSLEATAIRLTVPRLTSDDLAELEASMARMDHYEQAADPVGARAPHRALHQGLVAGAGERVAGEISRLAEHSERYRLRFAEPGTGAKRRVEHRAVLDAAKSGDAERAVRELVLHYARSAALVFGALDPDRDLERLRTCVRSLAPGAEDALSPLS
ncbi:GntR family transcriptional regulator [Streptomyces sp. NPDC048290]|uniref:GntR family transcriptional regulator n=1 Tax=Streptomyces sp. NPDC048290 TaxID=3155811 RepID=UPI0034293412